MARSGRTSSDGRVGMRDGLGTPSGAEPLAAARTRGVAPALCDDPRQRLAPGCDRPRHPRRRARGECGASADADVVGPRLCVRVDGGMADGPPRRLARSARGARRSWIGGQARVADADRMAPVDPSTRPGALDLRRPGRNRGGAAAEGLKASCRDLVDVPLLAGRIPARRGRLRVRKPASRRPRPRVQPRAGLPAKATWIELLGSIRTQTTRVAA